jgi:inosine/xanthosine triphosphatase
MAMVGGKSCVLGGTFTYIHAGHLRLLSACRKFDKIAIGLTSDAYVKKHKIYPSFSYEKRLAGLKTALRKLGLETHTAIHCIEDEAGGADRMPDVQTMIVSEETRASALRINQLRIANGLPELAIVSVPLVYGEDLKKISCVSIYEGKTDLQGRLRKPVAIQAGTDNPTKLAGASRALRRIFGKKFVLHGHSEHTGVPDHPFDDETFAGAKNRAIDAWKRVGGKCDYSVGMESGIFTFRKGLHIDITVCCVYDGKEEAYGTGMGFVVPSDLARKVRQENSDLSKVMAEAFGTKDIGRKHGAIGYFSDGKIHRSEQIEQSIMCAFVPRVYRAKVQK